MTSCFIQPDDFRELLLALNFKPDLTTVDLYSLVPEKTKATWDRTNYRIARLVPILRRGMMLESGLEKCKMPPPRLLYTLDKIEAKYDIKQIDQMYNELCQHEYHVASSFYEDESNHI